MKVLVLAAGYGTRLYPLTKDKPKPLLSFAGKPIMNHLIDKAVHLKSLSEVIVVTNERFHGPFEDWAKANKSFPVPIAIINDGTTTPEGRLGAVGDIDFVFKKKTIKEDLLVIGGDNLFDLGLGQYIECADKNRPHVSIGVYDIKNVESAKKFGVVKLDKGNKVISFEEKPQTPKSSLIAMCLYFFPKESLQSIPDYVSRSQKTDATGDYIRWLSEEDEVYGFTFGGKWYDIGSIEEYEKAQKDFLS
ncbi:MAG TPA: nucleotidyltransferase family protein [Candidatus Omnitrophota bacterium]|nr:nucleotidyltransferase family protein [Candidatus Omnitrophota bacterium]HPD84960.1 nucleotidyltransferase family protein [Candidatus Omnitrophota bacterium]HRZ03818.1 nucleotidyltransferase family protein [Candidatus Omnitrophota bacterium]